MWDIVIVVALGIVAFSALALLSRGSRRPNIQDDTYYGQGPTPPYGP